jgi:hypothetical protein
MSPGEREDAVIALNARERAAFARIVAGIRADRPDFGARIPARTWWRGPLPQIAGSLAALTVPLILLLSGAVGTSTGVALLLAAVTAVLLCADFRTMSRRLPAWALRRTPWHRSASRLPGQRPPRRRTWPVFDRSWTL